MSDLSHCIDLAIIGIETTSTSYKDLNTYGFQIFRGLKQTINISQNIFPDDILTRVISEPIQQARMNNGNVGILVLQSELLEKCKQTGLTFSTRDISGHKGDITSAWIATSAWLESESVEAVLLLEENHENQSVSTVLVCSSNYAADNGKQILAVVSGAAGLSETGKPVDVLIKSALKSGHLQPDMVGLVLASSPLEIATEMNHPQDLIASFPSKNGLSCALSGGDGGLLSVIKAVLCLSQRFIPGTYEWIAPSSSSDWENSAFYIPVNSRTWFTSETQPTRYALTINNSKRGASSVFIFRDGQSENIISNTTLLQETFFLLPINGNTPNVLLDNLGKLAQDISVQKDLRTFSSETINHWQNTVQSSDLVVCILGHDKDELYREIEFALKGIPAALVNKTDWRTPIGSYFTASPLGTSGSVAFVYPGAFNSYPGVGRDLFYLFPSLYEQLTDISMNLSDLLNEKMLYPRSISALSTPELDEAEKRLAADPLAMLISGTSLAALYTFLLRKSFDIHPASAFGYSLGEISMMFASGVWTKGEETSAALRASPLFHTRLAGPQNAVRENWGLPTRNQSDNDDSLWANYVLMSTPEAVNKVINNVNRVYMTHINTPRQVVIAGDPAACRKVIETLKCNSLLAPFNYALHCEAMQSEFEDLKTLHTWPISSQPGMTLYSAATYQAMPIDQEDIARQIGLGLCQTLDFPRLINQAYADGARIFIELGAGSNCSRWVDDSLKDRPHAAFSINRKGVDDHAGVLQLLAKLISHHVTVNLSAIIT